MGPKQSVMKQPSKPPTPPTPPIIAFAVMRRGKDWVPTRITIEGGIVAKLEDVGPAGPYRALAFQYLQGALMKEYQKP